MYLARLCSRASSTSLGEDGAEAEEQAEGGEESDWFYRIHILAFSSMFGSITASFPS